MAKKIIKWVFVAVFAGILITVLFVFIRGYDMYRQAVTAKPIAQMVEDIRASENYVGIDDIAPDFKTAVVSIEDKRFYTHNGFDFISFSRVFWENLLSMRITGGGSTITQQLAKNMYFTMEQIYTRKVAELLVAFDIERAYSKDDILELYLNIIYFGNGQYGVGDASMFYFGCKPSELNLEQILYLAGIPQAPSIYSVDDEKAEQRSKQVLAAMIANGYEYKEQQ